ncbi:MAG TPA: AraC family transcriptional regulator [Clostridiaceae bacterium]|nr:AraC family transcriptional regulator [Clostridiaceae bacterium]
MIKKYYSNPSKLIKFFHAKDDGCYEMDFHLHEFFEIYFFISGKVNYLIEKQIYQLKFGDLIIMNNHEIHKPSLFPGEPYERIVIEFDPAIASTMSSEEFNLLECFVNRPKGKFNKISLNNEQIDQVFSYLYKIENLSKSNNKSSSILKLTCFIELLVYINKLYSRQQDIAKMQDSTFSINMLDSTDYIIPEKLSMIMDYIDKNLEEDLSLETLGKKFFLDKYYLSRLFKKYTGSNIHDYILYKRISKAKRLLSEGHNAMYTSIKCGFNDYSNFYRVFKKTVGVAPSRYKFK